MMICYRRYWRYYDSLVIHMVRPVVNMMYRRSVMDNLVVNWTSPVSAIVITCIVIMMTAAAMVAEGLSAWGVVMITATTLC